MANDCIELKLDDELSWADTLYYDAFDNQYSQKLITDEIFKHLKSILKEKTLENINEASDILYSALEQTGIVELLPSLTAGHIHNWLSALNLNISIQDMTETSTERLDPEARKINAEINSKFLDLIYGNINLKNVVIKETNRNLFDVCFINRGSIDLPLGLVSSTQLNKNIRNYLETLFKRIVKYLLTDIPDGKLSKDLQKKLKDATLYITKDGEIYPTDIMDEIRPFLNLYLLLSLDDLSSLYTKYRTLKSTEKISAKRKLDAFNAMVILDNFDSYISSQLGKIIQIFNPNQRTGLDKYQISLKTANVMTTWRISENINISSEVGAIVKLAINTTPIYKFGASSPLVDRYLYFSDFQHIMGKIMDLPINVAYLGIKFDQKFLTGLVTGNIWNSLSKETQIYLLGKTLALAINMTKSNPKLYLHCVFEILTNLNFYKLYKSVLYDKVFSNEELYKLYSLHKGVFSATDDSSLNYLSRIGDNNSTNFYAYITQVASEIYNVIYLLYHRDKDGIVSCRTLTDLSIYNIKRSIEQSINGCNSAKGLEKDKFDNYEDYLDDKIKHITYELPIPGLNIKVDVTAGGNVTFKDSNRINYLLLWENPDVIKYLDSVLNLGLTYDHNFVDILITEYGSRRDTLCKSLLLFAANVLFNLYVSATKLLDLKLNEIRAELINIYGSIDAAPEYNYQLKELGLISKSNVPDLYRISRAKANSDGVLSASQVKDASGNAQSCQSLSRLLGSCRLYFDLLEKAHNSVTKDCLILNHPGLLLEIVTAKEYASFDTNKSIIDMSFSELAYSSILLDFIGGLARKPNGYENLFVGDNVVAFMPSVNSDKTTSVRIKINLATPINQKRIVDYNIAELQLLIAQDLGQVYTNIFKNVLDSLSLISDYLQGIYPDIPRLDLDCFNNYLNFNNWWNGNPRNFGKYTATNPYEFLLLAVLAYNSEHYSTLIELVDLQHIINKKGQLLFNLTLLALVARFNPKFILLINPTFDLNLFYNAEQFWKLLNAAILKSLLKGNFRLNTTKTNGLVELQYIRTKFPSWVNKSGDMILAKAIINNKEVAITSKKDLLAIPGKLSDKIKAILDSIVLNPILEKYNLLDYLFSLEFCLCTTGTFAGHADKSKPLPTDNSKERELKSEASKYNNNTKRNVNNTATKHSFLLNLLDGVPEDYVIATIDDVIDKLGTILGLLNTIKPFDGATFVDPFTVIMENNSLGESKAGFSKKQFVAFKNVVFGNGGTIKTAGFALTNDLIRNSPFMLRMMKKMTERIWRMEDGTIFSNIDITKDYNGNSILYGDIYFEQNGRYYLLTSIIPLGNNKYLRLLVEITTDGKPKSGAFIEEKIHVINSNYRLWNFLGGDRSLSFKNGSFLSYSNASVELVVIALNSIGYRRSRTEDVEISTLALLYLPLKHSDIRYLVTVGAMKLGGANINPSSRFYDNVPLSTLTIKMYESGILLDKEHHADNAEISLMTLVISACTALGYTYELSMELYNALHLVTLLGTKDVWDGLNKVITSGSRTLLLEVITKLIIDSLASSAKGNNNFVEVLASKIKEEAKKGTEIKYSKILLPLSDNLVYGKILSSISVFLTNAGIKLKIPGLLAVLNPSYNIMLLFANKKYETYLNPIEELRQLESELLPVYDVENPNTSITNIELGRTYRIVEILDVSTINPITKQPIVILLPKTVLRLINNPVDYYKLKNEIKKNKILKVTEAYVDDTDPTNLKPIGRDLAAYNVRGVTQEGENFQLWDLDSALTLFRLLLTSSPQLKLLIASDFFGVPILAAQLPYVETWVRRSLLRDLKNLSSSCENALTLYNKILQLNDNSDSFYRNYTYYVNILLGEPIQSGKLNYNGTEILVNASNFNEVNRYVLNKLQRVTKVKINGRYLSVIKESIKTLAYELIMPKVFATAFGLSEFDDLDTIKNNPDFFIDLFNQHLVSNIPNSCFTIELKKSNGNHYYVLSKDLIKDAGLKQVSFSQILKDNKLYRVDSAGNIMYEITPDTEIWQYKVGEKLFDVIITDNVGFYVDNLHYDVINLSKTLEMNRDTLSKTLEALKNSSRKRVVRYYNKLASESRKFLESLISKKQKLSGVEIDEDELNLLILTNARIDNLKKIDKNDPDDPIVRACREKHSSLLKSLEVIASRTPSQSMLSFMAMKVVAYDNPDLNSAYVSTLQILLQGSDYK